MSFIIRVLITAAVAYGLALLFEPHIFIRSYLAALVLVVVLGILNVLVKPLLILLTLPITIVTLGLFLLVINVLIILLADWFMDGFDVDGFWWALLFSVLLSFLSSTLGRLGNPDRRR